MEPLFTVDSDRSIERVRAELEAACARHKFGVLGVHDLPAKMRDKGIAFDRECLVFEVCSPQQAKRVLDAEISISTALPCRISVYREGGKTRLATIRPEIMLSMFGVKSLEPIACEVAASLQAIMRDAAGA